LEVVVYAIIRTGGKQYRVEAGELIRVERDVLGSASDDKVTFGEVLMVGGDDARFGAPLIDGASVSATIVRESRGEKIIVFKKKRTKQYKRKHGHRQDLVELRIDSIQL
jgi:large subunit ribosomal protein L21